MTETMVNENNGMIQEIEVTSLVPHPDNRSVTGLDEERIARLVDYIRRDGGFSSEYPLSVRPLADGCFQIVAGHHRAEAAKRLGITQVPCVVRDLDDVSALIRMITSNDQRDNNPLDIGAAARVACEKYSRDMSLSKFAEMVGIDNSSLAKLVQASNVAEYIGNGKIGNISNIIISNIKDKSFHLAEISQAPQPAWIPLVRLLSEKENTVSKMRNHVKMVKQLVASVPDFMMPSDEVIFDETGTELPSEKDKYIQSLAEIAIRSQPEASKRIAVFSEVAKFGNQLGVVKAVDYVATGIIVNENGLDHERFDAQCVEIDLKRQFVDEINKFSTVPDIDRVQSVFNRIKSGWSSFEDAKPFVLRCVLTPEEIEQQKEQQRLDELAQLKQIRANKIVKGDCVDALLSWQGKRIKLVLTDPPYGMAYQSNRPTASDKKKTIANDFDIDEALDIYGSALDALSPHLTEDAHLITFCNDDYAGNFRSLIESKGFQFKRLLVWVKPNHGTGDLTGSFAPRKELMIHAVKGRPSVHPRHDDVFIQDSKEITSHHPTEKPVSVLKRIIECTTIEGDMVVDPFAGVGSTLIAAIESNRDCWGAEIDDSYYTKAQSRLIETVEAE